MADRSIYVGLDMLEAAEFVRPSVPIRKVEEARFGHRGHRQSKPIRASILPDRPAQEAIRGGNPVILCLIHIQTRKPNKNPD
jgi:hypothetical protein